MLNAVLGDGFITTLVLAAWERHPLRSAITEYVPAPVVVAFVITGFWTEDVKPDGPLQE